MSQMSIYKSLSCSADIINNKTNLMKAKKCLATLAKQPFFANLQMVKAAKGEFISDLKQRLGDSPYCSSSEGGSETTRETRTSNVSQDFSCSNYGRAALLSFNNDDC